jgi:hypothetical protein
MVVLRFETVDHAQHEGGQEVQSREHTVDFFPLRVLYPSPSRPMIGWVLAIRADDVRKKTTSDGRGLSGVRRALKLLPES